MVAVDLPAQFVNREAAIRVAVERDAKIIMPLNHALLQHPEMRRAAVRIDVHAVRLVVEDRHVEFEPGKQLPRRGRGRAVRAVDQHAQAGELSDRRGKMIEILFLQRRAARHLPEVTVRLDRQLAGL